MQSQINNAYIGKLKEHIEYINDQALNDVNLSLNSEVLLQLNHDIEQRIITQKVKLKLIFGSTTPIKIIGIIGGKIAAKAGGKILTKGTAKIGATSVLQQQELYVDLLLGFVLLLQLQ